jgi:endonuclease/exonuclease/phosphatase family metal-dependent hydrolase
MKPWSLFVAVALLFVSSSTWAQPAIAPGEGRPVVMWEDARPLVGQVAFVCGKVIGVPTVGKITFINFDTQRPVRFAGVIFEDKLTNFPKPPSEMYNGKIVRIRGTVSMFKDQPQIVVTSPEQVEVLDSMPETTKPKQNAAVASKPGEVVVAAYNILNLFDEHDDPYKEDEGTPAKPRAQLERLAESIRALNADVIAVEEVENRFYLERFVNTFLPEMGYRDVVLFEGNDGRGIDVGLISRIPVGEVRSRRHLRFEGHDGGEARFNRDVLAVTLEPKEGKPFDVWVVHLKSNAGGREAAEPIRLAEAREVRRLLDEELAENAEARIIVTGDFNDMPESATLKAIVGNGDAALWSAGSDQKDPEAVTYNTGEYRSVIDFILCSPAMQKQYIKGSLRMPQGSIETSGSDHNPISATFRLN